MTHPASGPSTLWVGRGLADLGGIDPTHRAIQVLDGQITWTGPDPKLAPPTDVVHDLGEVWLTPGFVDAHVHATATGLAQSGVPLSTAKSVTDVLDRVARHVAKGGVTVVHGSGWDDSGWADDRPPTAAELDRASGGRPVVLIRVDGHSCVVSTPVLQALGLTGQSSGWLLESDSGRANSYLWAQLTPSDLTTAREATCRLAIGLGVTSIHEMGIPALSTVEDATAWATGEWPIEVHAYWADMQADPTGALRPGGDLFLDGSIGSGTAACSVPMTGGDGQPVSGALFHDDPDVAAFFVRATRAGVGAGVHAIGDRAIGQAIRAIQSAAQVCGRAAVRTARHRIEHAELVTTDQLAVMADLGVYASMQPAFDAVWNGPGGLYEHRFGRRAADLTNPLALAMQANVGLCFSSDSTVTPIDPWGGITAAQSHHGGLSLDRRTALHAATIGGHEVVSRDHRVGALSVGRRADFVAWPGDPLNADAAGWTPVATVAAGVHLT